jgi:hypothetical protein
MTNKSFEKSLHRYISIEDQEASINKYVFIFVSHTHSLYIYKYTK